MAHTSLVVVALIGLGSGPNKPATAYRLTVLMPQGVAGARPVGVPAVVAEVDVVVGHLVGAARTAQPIDRDAIARSAGRAVGPLRAVPQAVDVSCIHVGRGARVVHRGEDPERVRIGLHRVVTVAGHQVLDHGVVVAHALSCCRATAGCGEQQPELVAGTEPGRNERPIGGHRDVGGLPHLEHRRHGEIGEGVRAHRPRALKRRLALQRSAADCHKIAAAQGVGGVGGALPPDGGCVVAGSAPDAAGLGLPACLVLHRIQTLAAAAVPRGVAEVEIAVGHLLAAQPVDRDAVEV